MKALFLSLTILLTTSISHGVVVLETSTKGGSTPQKTGVVTNIGVTHDMLLIRADNSTVFSPFSGPLDGPKDPRHISCNIGEETINELGSDMAEIFRFLSEHMDDNTSKVLVVSCDEEDSIYGYLQMISGEDLQRQGSEFTNTIKEYRKNKGNQ